MSTFDGIIREIPEIRVDFFRSDPGRRPPLACFLSHVHSDHLAGLESLRSPFVYCSAPTRELLLHLERYSCRANYAKGILEARVQTYKHLKNLLKPIPLETPTTIELEPGRSLCVTLFDANHCTGAVMFLFEHDGKAVLYTGDIRSEPWHVNSIARSPCLLEYTSGIRSLDRIYLDTSFIDNAVFPTKAEGIQELLRKVAQPPDDTIFHFRAWTFGYESVWIALSKALKSQIHINSYKMSLYRALAPKHGSGAESQTGPEVPALVGFMCGNTPRPGCLTDDETLRLHSCEKGNHCATIDGSKVVHIVPVVTRLPDGTDVAEAGVGGGGTTSSVSQGLTSSACRVFWIQNVGISENTRLKIAELLEASAASGRNANLGLDISCFDEKKETNLAAALDRIIKSLVSGDPRLQETDYAAGFAKSLPEVITFPYSRHSSYPELCHLVKTFNPKDIWPCTVHQLEWIKRGINIRSLFGHCCSEEAFEFGEQLSELELSRQQNMAAETQDTQATRTSAGGSLDGLVGVPLLKASNTEMIAIVNEGDDGTSKVVTDTVARTRYKRSFAEYAESAYRWSGTSTGDQEDAVDYPQDSTGLDEALQIRRAAFNAAIKSMMMGEYVPTGLLSATDNHSRVETELDRPSC